jgi:hypothetical protein
MPESRRYTQELRIGLRSKTPDLADPRKLRLWIVAPFCDSHPKYSLQLDCVSILPRKCLASFPLSQP